MLKIRLEDVWLINLSTKYHFWLRKMIKKWSNETVVIILVGGFSAILDTSTKFFKIDLIPIKSYFLVRKNGKKMEKYKNFFGEILSLDWSALRMGKYKNENLAKFWV